MSVNMLSEMMSNVITEPHVKGSQKTLYEKAFGKFIHKTPHGTYTIVKNINGKMKAFGTYKTFQEACKIRDQLIARDWEPLPKPMEYYQKEYYKNIGKSGKRYKVRWIDGYMGTVDTLEEALYYRDIVAKHRGQCGKPETFDLKTNNPYMNCLKYPIPERLIIVPKESDYGTGYIMCKGPQSYHIWYGDEYFCACRTYEHAYYVKKELNKCGWNKEELPRILDEYPIWYTWLMNFWQYVAPGENGKGWNVVLTPRNNRNGKLEKLLFTKVEDALYERDLLLKYDFDEFEMIEAADENNPYYDMEIPPYPQRKVRRIVDREPRTELFNKLFDLIYNEGYYNQEQYCEMAGVSTVTLRNILRNEYDTTWREFYNICINGENPNDVLEQKPLIYNPNLEYIPPYRKNFVQVNNTNKRKSIYTVVYKGQYFGSYPTRALANKISNDMQRIGWDKSRLKEVQAKHGHKSLMNSKRWIYEVKYTSRKTGKTKIYAYQIRKKDKDRNIHNYGSYKDYDVACRIRDLLVECDWNKDLLESIVEQVKEEFQMEEI